MSESPQPLSLEQLEDRLMLSTVTIFAQGSVGDETLQVYVDGQNTNTITSIPANEQIEVDLFFDRDVQADDIRLEFTNDLYDPANGIDRNVTVDRIEIDGRVYQTENAAVFSTGTWRPQDGVTNGFGRGETLNSNGFFQYSNDGLDGVNETTEIRVSAGVFGGDVVDFDLVIDGNAVASYSLSPRAGSSNGEFVFLADGNVTADQIRVQFTNDAIVPNPFGGGDIDRNLRVDFIEVDGERFVTDSPTVFSTGSWQDGAIEPGFGRGNILHSNGYFQYSSGSTNTQISIDARGFGDVVDFELRIDGTAVQQYALSPRAGQSTGTFTYNAAGNIDPSRVQIAFTNDLIFDNPFGGGLIDRNLEITSVSIGNLVFDPGSDSVFSTGTWRPEDGVTPGFGRGNMLHSNGYFQFG
jgi:hypothetical protein